MNYQSPDENRSITPAREKAMKIIIDIKNGLKKVNSILHIIA